MGTKRVYYFDEGRIDQKDLLGNKGVSFIIIYIYPDRRLHGAKDPPALHPNQANLCERVRMGLPVPTGFVITTTTCLDFFKANKQTPPGLKEEYLAALARMEKETGKKFGDKENPLLLSVRSGAAVSMPGMMVSTFEGSRGS